MEKLLAGKKGLIFGALDEKSIAWKVAEEAHREGATFVLTNAPAAARMGSIGELAEQCDSVVIPADATSQDDLNHLISQSLETLGGKIDFILHSIGMSLNVRKGRHYTDVDYNYFHKTLDISALSLHRVLQECMKQDAINEWGSVIALTYIASQRVFPNYNDMAEAKSMLESICRSFGYHYGMKRKVRINTVSQSPTDTTAGSKVDDFGEFLAYANAMSPLGNADARDCARFCVALFSDLTHYITMQTIYHDGGFASTGMSDEVMHKILK
ncbi:MAG: enoyl-ACP reductase [Flavobacteriales bacterium]